jgi:autotransporter-associated beta strand protein
MKQHIHLAGFSGHRRAHAFSGLAATASCLLLGFSNAAAGTPNSFNTGTDLTLGTNYSGGTPTNASDVSLTTSSAALTMTAAAVTMESLTDPGTVTYTVNNISTATASTLTLGNSSGFTNANDSVANDLIYLAGTKNLTIAGGVGDGTLGIVLASDGNIDNAGTGTLTINGNISGAQALTITGTGTDSFTGTNTFSSLAITAGELDISSDASLGAVPTSATADITINGGRLGSNSGLTFTINANRTILLGSTVGSSLSVKGSTGSVTYNGSFADLTTGGILVKQGAGALILGGVSTYTGQTSINNGTIQLNVADALPATVLNIGQSGSVNLGNLNLNGFNQTVAGLTSTPGINTSTTLTNVVTSSTAATLTVNTANGTSYTYSAGTVANSGVISGAVSLMLTGAGTQTLGGANTYTGTTTVNGGILVASNASGSSATGTGAVTVGGSGTLEGTGYINAGANPVTINGTLSPGAGLGSAATLNIASTATTGGLTLSAGSVYAFDLTSTTTKDLVALATSSLALNGGTLALNLPNTSKTGIDYTQTYSLFTGVSGLSGAGFNTVTGYDSTDYTPMFTLAGTTYNLSFVAVPEPSPLALGTLLALGMLGWYQRRRFVSSSRPPI